MAVAALSCSKGKVEGESVSDGSHHGPLHKRVTWAKVQRGGKGARERCKRAVRQAASRVKQESGAQDPPLPRKSRSKYERCFVTRHTFPFYTPVAVMKFTSSLCLAALAGSACAFAPQPLSAPLSSLRSSEATEAPAEPAYPTVNGWTADPKKVRSAMEGGAFCARFE